MATIAEREGGEGMEMCWFPVCEVVQYCLKADR